MKHFIGIAAIAFVAVGCSKGKDQGAEGAPTPVEAKAPSVVAGAPVPGAADDRCADPCRMLATTALADMASACSGSTWREPDCATADYDRNCIYAESGYTFTKKRWKTAFGVMKWYAPRTGFKQSDLSAVARANVTALKAKAAACKGGDTATPETRAAVKAFLADLAAGTAVFPDVGLDTTSSPPEHWDAAQLRKTLTDDKATLVLTPGTKMRYVDVNPETKAALGDMKARGVEVSFATASPGCAAEPDDGCDGGITLTFVFDLDNKLVAIEHLFAG